MQPNVENGSNGAKLWFAYKDGHFKGEEPFFFDTSPFPWVKRIESQWTVIRDELQALVRGDERSMTPYPNRELTNKPDQWKTFGLMFWKMRSRENSARCPRTWELLQTIPNVLAGSFNVLEPGTTIKPHWGDTNAIIRCHLGLDIPSALPDCGFRVGTETRGWKNGSLHMFCDAHLHTSWNNTKQKRYIFIIDIMRPEFAAQTNSICSNVLSNIYLEVAYQRIPFLQHFKNRRRKAVLHGLMRPFFHVAVQSRLPFSLPS